MNKTWKIIISAISVLSITGAVYFHFNKTSSLERLLEIEKEARQREIRILQEEKARLQKEKLQIKEDFERRQRQLLQEHQEQLAELRRNRKKETERVRRLFEEDKPKLKKEIKETFGFEFVE